MTRARSDTPVCAPQRRTYASARLRVCANVFAQSRIHFDVSRALNAGTAAIDRAAPPRPRFAVDDDDDGDVAPRCASGSREIITH